MQELKDTNINTVRAADIWPSSTKVTSTTYTTVICITFMAITSTNVRWR